MKKKNLIIQIIEKDKSVSSILEFILSQNNFSVQVFNTNTIPDNITYTTSNPKLIIMDNQLPYLIKTTLFDALKKQPEIPILMMINNKITASQIKKPLQNILGYFYKPLDSEEIIKTIIEIEKKWI